MQLPKEQSIRSKLGSILGIGSSRTTPVPQRNLEDLSKLEHNTFFTADVLRELDSNQPLQRRVRALRENLEVVTMKRLEEHAVEAIWTAIKDMIEPSQPVEVRQYTLTFLRNLIYGQFEDLGVLRAHFMSVVQTHKVTEDAQHRLEILCVLTQNGKNIHHLEESIGPFLKSWMPEVVTLGHSNVFLLLLINFVHYNAAYLDGDVLVSVVRTTCILAGRSQNPEILVLCLDFINAVVCYSSLPSECLVDLVTTLCQMLNIEKMAKQCLEVMLKLLGTHLGRSAIYTMCTILQERSGESCAYLLRGAVFFVSMSLWGIRKVETLDVTFASVLPFIRQSVLSHQTLVVFEAALSVLRLVRTYARDLNQLEWDSIYDIMEGIQDHLRLLKDKTGQDILPPKNTLGQCQRDLFLAIEDCYDGGRGINIGEPDKFFDLVEGNVDALPLKSVLNLVSYRTSSINNGGIGLVEKVVKLMEKFYVQEKRPAVRIEVLNYLSRLMDDVSSCYEGQLMENVVQRYLQGVAGDPDLDVRCRSAQLLVQLLTRSSSKWSTLVLALINSILQHGLEVVSKQVVEALTLQDSKTVVYGLTQAFKEKLHSSSPVAAQILSMLVVLLQQHYDEGYYFPAACNMRTKIFACILSLRSNEYFQVGFLDGDSVMYSPFFVCRQSGRVSEQDLKISPMLLDYRSTFSAVLACLEKECDWDVLAQVLELLRTLLQDRILTLSAQPDLSPLCLLLCNLVGGQKPRLRSLKTTSGLRTRADPSSLVFPVLTTLTTYPSHLDRKAQHSLVYCLNTGVVGSCAQLCVSSLSLCSLELQATMTHLLPHILLRMSQVAATPAMALSVLEFLSNLIPIPALYSGFVDQEYLSVFAIALPYTNHRRNTNYVIAMAHRVIAQWFVNCRMHYRPVVANFVCKKLASNLEEALSAHGSPVKSVQSVRSEGTVGVEMMEVCMDMMARYTYSNLSTLPSRNSGSDFLVAGGPTKTWFVGNSLVTITTSTARESLCKFCLSNRPKYDSIAGTTGSSAPRSLSDYLSACTCQASSWAEIKIRRPAGNTGWMMHLQNRPHPLSLTHPSAHKIPENEISLLSTSLPLSVVGESGTGEKGELFFSRDVGSFTDISFLSSMSTEFSARKETSNDETAKKSATTSSEHLGVKCSEGGDQDKARQEETEDEEASVSAKRMTANLGEWKAGGIHREGETSAEEKCTVGEIADGSGSLKEASLSEKQAMKLANDSFPDTDCRSSSDVSLSPSQPKRSANSQSWSESAEVSPLGMLSVPPRASSLSYAMEHLPPLFSYDENDEFSRSPSLHQGALQISDEEQLTLHASMNDLLSKESGSDTGDNEESFSESSSTDVSETSKEVPISECKEEDKKETMDAGDQGKAREEKKESKKEEREVKAVRTRTETEQKQVISLVGPGAAAATVVVVAAATSQQQSPTVNRRQNIPPPPGTPPLGGNSSPSICRKKLVYSQRPLSASGGSSDSRRVNTSIHRREENEFNNPSFIFLQLYNSRFLGDPTDLPILVPANETTDRAIKVFDHIPPYETHKLGVIYVKKGQTTELQILSNTCGSSRYLDFLRGLGPIMKLSDIPPDMIYLGGLDQSGTDGDFTYCFHDDITQVVYHVATLMPSNLQADPSCSNKKLHIGNDFVTIVYNDSEAKYKFGTIKGQFNYVEVVIEPLLEGVNQVSLHAKQGLEGMLQMSPVCVSDSCLPLLVRQKALQANLASIAYASLSATGIASALDCNLSNWLGRLHQIKKIQEKCRPEAQPPHHPPGNSQASRAPRISDSDRGLNTGSNNATLINNFTNYS